MNKKSSIIIIILVGLLAVLAMIFYLSSLPQKERRPAVPELAGEVSLSLISPKNNYQVGELVLVDVLLDSGSELVDGVDIILQYNPASLQLKAKNAAVFDKTGSVFGTLTTAQIDEKEGRLAISGLSVPPQGHFQGRGKVFSLEFEAKKSGQTEVSFVFEPGLTSDSNVSSFSRAEDVLTKVINLELLIF